MTETASEAWKDIEFLGDSLKRIREFPDDVRREAGYQLGRVQQGMQPNDFRPMPAVGQGVEEIRIHEESGAFRVFYIAKLRDMIYVLHAFQKKSRATPRQEIDIARKRYNTLR